MRPSEALATHREAVLGVIGRFPVANPRLFGSALRGEDREGSDLDLLVDGGPTLSLLGIMRLEINLEDLLGVPVQVTLPSELHPLFRDEVLAAARSL